MREIKFRAWMPKEKKWYKGGAVQLIALQGNTFGLSEASGKIIQLQQFTGLTDRHGVEIYEGDVVRFVHDDQTIAVLPVIWNSKGAFFTCEHDNISRPVEAASGFDSVTGEIVGNIYETPELLTKEQ